MRNSLVGSDPSYLRDFSIIFSSVPGRGTLRSASCGLLTVPRMRTSSSVHVGPTILNGLPRELLLELLGLSLPRFRKRKSVFFWQWFHWLGGGGFWTGLSEVPLMNWCGARLQLQRHLAAATGANAQLSASVGLLKSYNEMQIIY